MKVAVLLCGQPRRALDTCTDIINKIILPNNADVFIHCWYDSENKYIDKVEKDRGCCIIEDNIDQKLIEIYKPKSYFFEKQKFKNFNNYNCDYFKCNEKYINNLSKCGKNQDLTYEQVKTNYLKGGFISQLYSIFRCNLIKEEYGLENNILYDCVIRLRFDVTIQKTLICEDFDMNYIYYQAMGQPDGLISDWFNMGSNQIMNIYSSVFLNLKYLNDCEGFYKYSEREKVTYYDGSICTIAPEYLFRDLFYKYNIPKKGIDLGIGHID